MIKKFIMMTIAALVFVACGDDNEPDTPEVSKAVKLVYNASLELSQDLFDVADIRAYYIDANGRVASEAVTSTKWTKSVEQPLPCKYGIAVSCTSKSGVQIDSETNYTLQIKPSLSVEYYDSKGSSMGFRSLSMGIKTGTILGSSLASYLSRMSLKVAYESNGEGEDSSTTIDWGFNAGDDGTTTETGVSDDPATGEAK
ncbi:MAG: hypothetical protein ACI4B3_04520 [Prevotella sp.]